MSEDTWNFDMSEAPRGFWTEAKVLSGPKGKERLVRTYHAPKLIVASRDGKTVTVSKWLPDTERWEMFTQGNPPAAWRPWPVSPFAHTPSIEQASS